MCLTKIFLLSIICRSLFISQVLPKICNVSYWPLLTREVCILRCRKGVIKFIMYFFLTYVIRFLVLYYVSYLKANGLVWLGFHYFFLFYFTNFVFFHYLTFQLNTIFGSYIFGLLLDKLQSSHTLTINFAQIR